MKRRDFLAASCAAGLAPLGASAASAASAAAKKELYDLRLYQVASAEKKATLLDYLAKAAVPAWNRLGIRPVGIFEPLEGEGYDLWVLLPHASCESLLTLGARLMADAAFVQAAAAVLDAPMNDPVYDRIESSLLVAFDGVPKIELPTNKPTRVFQLRIYESHNLAKAQKKIEMFNSGGELEIFRRVGMPPVFFGEALAGPRLPNLTYMLGFDDRAAMDAGWKAFLADPAWAKLKADPQYADTVSNITNILLKPADGSQV